MTLEVFWRLMPLIIVNTPVGTHFEYAKSNVGRGKHASRKAFTTTVAEAEELPPRKSETFVFQNRRWDSDLKTVRQVLLDGVLGNIVEAEFHFDQPAFESEAT
jgi:predicted dehydrogenase